MPEFKVGDVVEVVKTDWFDNIEGIYQGDKLVVRSIHNSSISIIADGKNGGYPHVVFEHQIKLVKREGEKV